MSVRRRRRLALTAASLAAAASLTLGAGSATASTTTDSWAWGYNADGQLGNGTTTDASVPRPVNPPTGITFTAIAVGGQHACGLTSEGTAYCWGSNSNGQLGNGAAPANSTTPVAVTMPSGVTFTSLTAAAYHTCGVALTGSAYCWGSNNFGQLGNGGYAIALTPQLVSGSSLPGGAAFSIIAAGSNFTCGILATGAAYCWGSDTFGQLGNGASTSTPVPSAVDSVLTFTALAAGAYHTCGLTPAGAAHCWGYNYDGQLGNGNRTNAVRPVAVNGPLTLTALAAGAYHTCGLTPAGADYCWGWNSGGQLGNGTTVDASTPQPVIVGSGESFTAITAGFSISCGLTAAGAAFCWGSNSNGQLGNGNVPTGSALPVSVSGDLTLAAVVSGAGSFSTYGLAPRPASGDDVPRAALQQFARAQAGTCEAQPDDLADFPALTAVRHQQWAPSWAQWPNSGTGGYVCTRQPYYTSIGTWAVQ